MSSSLGAGEGVKEIGKLPPPSLRIDERSRYPRKRKNPEEDRHPGKKDGENSVPPGKVDIQA